MKIIIMGTGPFAVPSCQQILASGHEIPLVVTRPLPVPPPKKTPPRPVYDWAIENRLPVFEPASINSDEAIAELQHYAADLYFVCDYGQILSKACLSAAKLGGINLHGSILPRHRGAAPVQWSILRGDREAGATVIHMTPKLDAGPALQIVRTPIEDGESAAELEPRLAELGVSATLKSIQMLETWDGTSPIGETQDQSLVTRAPRFSKADGTLDFRLPADYLVRLVRACQPWPGTFAMLQWPDGGKELRVIVRGGNLTEDESFGLSPGEAVAVDAEKINTPLPQSWKQVIAVGTSQGVFLVGSLQPAGKREMLAEEFLRGHPLVKGCRFAFPEPARPQLDS